MIIAVNTRLLIKNKLEGIGWFTYETLVRITQNHPEHTFYFLFDRKPHPDFIFASNVIPVVLKPQARHPLLWYIWFEISVSWFLRKHRVDLFVSPDGFIPLKCKIPCLNVIHDINFHHFPNGIPLLTRKYYNYFFPRFAQKAARIVTVSEYSKADIAKSFKININKIDVAHNGANKIFKPEKDFEIQEIRTELTNGKPYFLFVGALSPRKNVARLILAFNQFCKIHKSDIKLVIVGERMFMTNDIKDALSSITDPNSIVFCGRLQIERLQQVMSSALALVYTPYFEGFGIPLVEAMRCHLPIIASNRTSIPEVVGDAALIVDPFDVDAIATAMAQIATNPNLRKELAQKSAARKEIFSWDKTAQTLYNAMIATIKEKSINNA